MQCLLFLHLCLQLHFKDLLMIWQCVCVAELWSVGDILSGYWGHLSVAGFVPHHHSGQSTRQP
jgi:hypothetical protein